MNFPQFSTYVENSYCGEWIFMWITVENRELILFFPHSIIWKYIQKSQFPQNIRFPCFWVPAARMTVLCRERNRQTGTVFGIRKKDE